MKTILHVVPTLTGGGAERQLALLASEQAQRGWNVHVALRRRGGYSTAVEARGVRLHELGDFRRGHPLLFARLAALVRRLAPDLLQTWLVQMDIVGGLVAIAAGVPWVMTERCSAEAYNEFPLASRVRSKLGRRARAIVANSTLGANDWRAIVPDSCDVSVIGNAVDIAAIDRAEPNSIGERPVLLAVGRLVHQKAHDVLLEAAAQLPRELRAHVVILGEGERRSQLLRTIETLRLNERVSILPYREDWWGLLKTSHALVNASRFEGQPNVVLEAMAAGCPVVVSDIPSHRDVVDATMAVFVERENAGSLARAMIDILTNRDAARERARRASVRVTAATIAATAAAYEQVYADVLG